MCLARSSGPSPSRASRDEFPGVRSDPDRVSSCPQIQSGNVIAYQVTQATLYVTLSVTFSLRPTLISLLLFLPVGQPWRRGRTGLGPGDGKGVFYGLRWREIRPIQNIDLAGVERER